MSNFDLSAITYQPSLKLDIRLPSGQPSGWIVELMGPGHPQTEAINAELRRFRAAQRLEQQQAERKNRPYQEDDEATAAFFEEWFAKRLIGWSAVSFNGQDFPANAENKRKIFAAEAFGFVRDQIHEAWKAAEDFLPKPKKGSDPSPETTPGSTSAKTTEGPSAST